MSSEQTLAHYGVKGMKWGVRRDRPGSDVPSSSDHQHVSDIRTRAGSHGKHTLSNKELQDAITRMNLEQQFDRLSSGKNPNAPGRIKKGEQYLKNALSVGKTVNEVVNFVNSPTGKFIKKQLKSG